jgi:two-component system cell cycle response regulator
MSMTLDRSKVRVLITDDEDSIRSMLVSTLQEAGWSVDGAKNGKEALEKLRASQVHIIVSDINMPEMTGIELLEAVRRDFPKTEFIVMTSNATLETAIKAVSLGAYDYLNKPFEDINVVPKKLEKVAEKILLRQQNAELLRRLKSATMELKRLFQVISPFNGILDLSELRKTAIQGFPTLFDDLSCRASWWVKNSEEGWECLSAQPQDDSFKGFSDPQAAQDAMTDLRNPMQCLFKSKDGHQEAILFENLKDVSTQIYLQQINLCFEKASFHADIASLANKDGLTRLYNHRYFQERLRQELAQAQRQNSEVSLLLMDVDHFKHFNDRNGHPAGDALLKALADLLSQQKSTEGSGKRMTDILARYGGEEFVMILPFTLHDGAKVKAERICQAVASFPFEFAEHQPLKKLSLSVGVASFPEHGATAEELIAAADRALYAAKRAGRNQFKSAHDAPASMVMETTQEMPMPPTHELSVTKSEAPQTTNLSADAIAQKVDSPKTLGSLLAEEPTHETALAEEVAELAQKMEKLTEETQKDLELVQKKISSFQQDGFSGANDVDLTQLMTAIDEAIKQGKA